MKVYQLNVVAGENDADGENFDEWFTSLRAARARRAELIAETKASNFENVKYGHDLKIVCFEVADMPLSKLVLALLNQRGWATAAGGVLVVPPVDIAALRRRLARRT